MIPDNVNILQAVIDATPDAIFVKDLEGRYLLVNIVTAGFLGKTPDEFVGKCDTDLYPVEMADKYIDADREVLRSGDTKVFEDVATLGGVTHEYLVTKKVYRDRDGKIAGLFGISRDISARKRAEAAIRKSAEYRNLFVLANDPIVIFEPDSQVVIDVNDKACEAYGFSREAFIGRSFKTLSQDVPHGEAHWAQLLAEGTIPAFEAVQFRADGTPVAFLISASLIEYRGQKAVLSINRDITERKRIEAELETTRDAALESVRLKSEFLANMSHEIRTPMNGIIGMTDLTLDTKLTGKQREYLEMVKASADSLLGVVNDILDFSKIEAGKLRLEPIAFDLHDSVGDAMKTLALRAHEKGLELTYYVAPDVPAGVVGDPDRIRQILVNLVSNAIKFTRFGEVSVRIETARLTPDDDASLHFSVTDTGIGIPREKQILIFEPFAQADGSITRQYGGTGLGLAITRQLIDLMDGRLWVESPVLVHESEGGGPGSTFHFVMPLRAAPVTEPRLPEVVWPVHDLPILIVDDNRTNRRILQEALFNWQMQPTAVESGRAALDEMSRAAAAGRPFSLVLLDAHMPGMDGFTMAEEVRRTPAIAGAAIMILSSVGEHIYAERLRTLGLAAYFTKPIKLSELHAAILQLLEPGSSDERDVRQTGSDPTVAEVPHLRVLVVEDTFINQQLAIALLTKRGYATELAVNGKEALAALELRQFDIVLMDVQMPEMNGLEATRRIRAGEQTGVHLPIIAMTAHAMKGDRERCLDAGMDDYVAKPIRPVALWEAIDRLVPSGIAISECVPLPPTGVGAFDHAALLSCANGNLDLAHELADIFLATSPGLLAEIHDAVAKADGGTLERAAHSMKSAISYFANAAGVDAAARLEKMGCTGELASANTVAATLEQNVENLVAALGTFKKESAS